MSKPSEYKSQGSKPGSVREASASEVKNAWHSYLDRVRQGREDIVITRYGKPVARLCPIEEPEEKRGIVGWLAGTVTVHGDLVAPLGDEWEADA
ncbi:type II toxin-antitoxin system Phd/YefM family antitoxin [soil metagenome]|jgi:prevent-host-death family protein